MMRVVAKEYYAGEHSPIIPEIREKLSGIKTRAAVHAEDGKPGAIIGVELSIDGYGLDDKSQLLVEQFCITSSEVVEIMVEESGGKIELPTVVVGRPETGYIDPVRKMLTGVTFMAGMLVERPHVNALVDVLPDIHRRNEGLVVFQSSRNTEGSMLGAVKRGVIASNSILKELELGNEEVERYGRRPKPKERRRVWR